MGTETMSDGLSNQGGISNNLALDEVQNQLGNLGKPLKSMNLYELLKNVSTADNNQGANCQPSLSKKTVDELWQDIQHGLKKIDNGGYSFDDRKIKREKEPTLGEMTLEDFLAKAGIDANPSPEKKENLGDESVLMPKKVELQQTEWMQYQIPPSEQEHQGLRATVDVEFPEVKMEMCPTPLMGTVSDAETHGRKRYASGDWIEKTVERRQKRMIKNRESAARSRARKEAYTNELENKISWLREENGRLKREQEIEIALPFIPPSEPRYQLRRTSSM